MSIRSAFTTRSASADHEHAVRELERRWLEGCAYVGLGRMQSTGAGPVVGLRPKPVRIVPSGPTPHLIVELHPGQLMADLEARRDELARALNVWALRFTDRGGDYVRVDLVRSDPLAADVPFLPPAPDGHLVYGVDEVGATVFRPLRRLTSHGVQGATGSGKSVFCYSLLIQLVRLAPLVDIVGIDPTNLLLGPLGAHPQGWRIGGTEDAAARYPALLAQLVDDMDDRIRRIPPRHDSLPITREHPLRVVVLEELAGISRMTGYRQSGAPSETQRHIGRLASEGRKGGYRLLVISQRLGADVLATDTRDQLLSRWTFGTRDLATLRMLSPDATPEDLGPLASSPPGVALVDMPGSPMTRVRGPWLGGEPEDAYGRYCDELAAVAGA